MNDLQMTNAGQRRGADPKQHPLGPGRRHRGRQKARGLGSSYRVVGTEE